MRRFTLCCLLLSTATVIRAATPPPIDHEWALPAPNQNLDPKDICLGPDGNMWFTLNGAPKIGRITPEGVITLFPTGSNLSGNTYGICVGPDGNLWFTESTANKIGKMSVDGILLNEYGSVLNVTPKHIVAAPDGHMYFPEANNRRIGNISTSGTWSESTALGGGSTPPMDFITVGLEGHIWFTQPSGGMVFDLDPVSGGLTPFSSSSPTRPGPIIRGLDRSLWLSDPIYKNFGIVRDDIFSIVPWPSGTAFTCMVLGPDARLWGSAGNNLVGHLEDGPSGPLTNYSCSLPVSAIARGPGSTIWITLSQPTTGSAIGVISVGGLSSRMDSVQHISESYPRATFHTWGPGNQGALVSGVQSLVDLTSQRAVSAQKWNAQTQRFERLDAPASSPLRLGDGVFLSSRRAVDIPISLGEVEQAPFSIGLLPGWNLISVPLLADGPNMVHDLHPLSECTLYDSSNVALHAAQRASAIGSVVFAWNGSGYDSTTVMKTGQAYWIKNSTSQVLRLCRVDTASGGVLVSAVEERDVSSAKDYPPAPGGSGSAPSGCGFGSLAAVAIAIIGIHRRRMHGCD